jgi:predicted ribosome quality control (RQC) complex YloA/Tae2 family protein
MAIDGLTLHQLVLSLQADLPAKINKITQPSNDEILLGLRGQGKSFQWLLCAHSQYNRINITEGHYANPTNPSGFVMLLRKHLENGIITQLEQGGLDRYVIITVKQRDEFGDQRYRQLIVELMGKYANIILCEPDGLILDALKRIPPYDLTKRVIYPGAYYQQNDKPTRLNPLNTNTFNPHLTLSEQFDGFSPLLSSEVIYRWSSGQSFQNIITELTQSNQLYYYPSTKQFHVLPLTHLKTPPVVYPLNSGLDMIYHQAQQQIRIEQLAGDLNKLIRKEIKKLQNKLPKLNQSLTEAYDCLQWKDYGDLIFGHLWMITKGQTQVVIPDYTTQVPITIELDPKLDGKRNGQKYYQRYQKGRNAQSHLTNQITIAQQQLEYLMGLDEQLSLADVAIAMEIRLELEQQGYLKSSVHKHKKAPKLHVETIRLPQATIYIGHNNLQNEMITFKLANKQDWWFHAKDYHGAHVVIVADELDEELIRTGANLAAYYSKGRYSSTVPVNYTQVKNIKKVPNRPPGLVTISTYKTIFIDPVKP